MIGKLTFTGGITGSISAQNLSGVPGLNRPTTFSEIFREGDSLFAYIPNRDSYNLVRLGFTYCDVRDIPSSTLFNPPSFSYPAIGTYTVELIVNQGMDDQTAVCREIVVNDQVAVSLGRDTVLCEGVQLVLTPANQTGSYLWSTGDTSASVTIHTTGNYWVIVTTTGTCQGSDTIFVKFDPCGGKLWFPNVFTPNGDTWNETFHPVGTSVRKFTMYINDRWGRKVFETNSVEPGWDGTCNGQICSDGVYVYLAVYEMDDPPGVTFTAKGTVTILR
jgi:gliding motility-associated-like protein